MHKIKRKSNENVNSPSKKPKLSDSKLEKKQSEKVTTTNVGEFKKKKFEDSKGAKVFEKGKGKKFSKPGNNKGKDNFSKTQNNGEKPKWSEMKKEKKQLRIVRRKAKATAEVFEVSHKAKLLAAQIQRWVLGLFIVFGIN